MSKLALDGIILCLCLICQFCYEFMLLFSCSLTSDLQAEECGLLEIKGRNCHALAKHALLQIIICCNLVRTSVHLTKTKANMSM